MLVVGELLRREAVDVPAGAGLGHGATSRSSRCRSAPGAAGRGAPPGESAPAASRRRHRGAPAVGGGRLPTGFFSTPMGASVRAPYRGTRAELMEVLDLARAGAVHVEVEKYTLDEVPEAYRRLHEGAVRGRAVVVPGA
ncbi:zinc-binding dehydrogenase [Geodermatophilus africanus]|uniref:zinc-binding dehydrogenase n=1 Tax=Geodermatophilus africanus TaxID=1137993 RepID=UPI00244EB918|nr:zinc-binding dehydrogenase [Geodermatophilus africanus]